MLHKEIVNIFTVVGIVTKEEDEEMQLLSTGKVIAVVDILSRLLLCYGCMLQESVLITVLV